MKRQDEDTLKGEQLNLVIRFKEYGVERFKGTLRFFS